MKRDKLEAIKARALDDSASLEERRTCALLFLQKEKESLDSHVCESCTSKDAMIRYMTKEGDQKDAIIRYATIDNDELRQLVETLNQEVTRLKNRLTVFMSRDLSRALQRRRF